VGAWGHRAFDNDTANDWAYGLEGSTDLSLVEAAFDQLEAVRDGCLDADLACEALAACEVLARSLGNAGYTNAYTEKVDTWVATHQPRPPTALLDRARSAVDRILGGDSELRELWEDGDGEAWRKSVEDLRARLSPHP
jgi:hypothetical protein